MTYDEALQFWFGRVNYEQKAPRFGDFKLERMRALLSLLGNPQDHLRIIHIAGSKGKGSTSALLDAILRREGYRTGLFTSPHLVRVEERFQVDGQAISSAELTSLLAEVRAACTQRDGRSDLEQQLTFFEITTAVGMLHFVRRRVDFAVLEVGLGGRFDSTNVCLPLVAVITSISHDHTQILGDDLASIAHEKAGIIKPGRTTISGVRAPEARDVIRATCRERGSRLVEIDTDFGYEHEPARVGPVEDQWPRVRVRGRQCWPPLALGLIGEHQAANAALAVATIEELRRLGVPVSDRAVQEGLAGVRWPARLEILGRRPLVVLDCAHNVASAQALRQALTTSFPLPPGGQARLIFASSRDKDVAGILDELAPAFDRIYLTCFQNNPRCVPPEQLVQLVPADQRDASTACPTARAAWELARREARPADLICIAGSVFLAGELRPLILAEQPGA